MCAYVRPSVRPFPLPAFHWYAATFSLFSRAVHNHAKRSHLISAWSSRSGNGNGSNSSNESENNRQGTGAEAEAGKATAATEAKAAVANNVAYFFGLAVEVDAAAAAAAAVIVDAGDLGLAWRCQSCWTFNFRFSFTHAHTHTHALSDTVCMSEIGRFFVVVCNICWLFWRCLFFALYLAAHTDSAQCRRQCECVCV